MKNSLHILALVASLFVGVTLLPLANAKTPEENKAEGVAFLATNAKNPNIKTTPIGLQYEILVPGKGGKSPTVDDKVLVHYSGKVLNGEEFANTFGLQPIALPLNQVISGWKEGLQLMAEGAKYRFYIPTELAYGVEGAESIEPNVVLIFEIELLKIN